MADGQSVTVADVVAQVRDGRLEDFVKEAVAIVARELMDAQISAEVGAGLGEVAPETRLTHRNGYPPRPWETRVREIELSVRRSVRAARISRRSWSRAGAPSRRSSRLCWRRTSMAFRPGRSTGSWNMGSTG